MADLINSIIIEMRKQTKILETIKQQLTPLSSEEVQVCHEAIRTFAQGLKEGLEKRDDSLVPV